MITAHFPPFEGPVDKLWDSRLDSRRYDEPLLYKPAIPEVDARNKQVGGTHYAEMEIQPWTAMRAWMTPDQYLGYHIGTVVGYLARHAKKGGLTDIKKAKHHLEELIRYFENDEEYPG